MLIYNTYAAADYYYHYDNYYCVLFFLKVKDTINAEQQQRHACIVSETNLWCFPEELLQGVAQ